MLSINTAKMVTKMPFKNCIYVLTCFTIYTLYCISTYLEKSLAMSRYWIASGRGWGVDTKSIMEMQAVVFWICKCECWQMYVLLGVAHFEYHLWRVIFLFRGVEQQVWWADYLSRVYRWPLWFRYSGEVSIKNLFTCIWQISFCKRNKKLDHIPVIGWYI